MKIFLGVAASAPLMTAAGELSRQLQARTAAVAPLARVAWVPPDRFHLTVLFIGHVTPPQLDAVRAALARPLSEPRFELAIEGTGVFPGHGAPRVIWAGCGAGREAFARLQREAHARVSAVVPLPSERDTQPHLTLARVKDAGGLRGRALLEHVADLPLGTMPVRAVSLFESRPMRAGVEYVPLLDVPLSAGCA